MENVNSLMEPNPDLSPPSHALGVSVLVTQENIRAQGLGEGVSGPGARLPASCAPASPKSRDLAGLDFPVYTGQQLRNPTRLECATQH